MALLPFGAAPTPTATQTARGKQFLGAFCYTNITAPTTVQVPANLVMLQVMDLTISGILDLTLGDMYMMMG